MSWRENPGPLPGPYPRTEPIGFTDEGLVGGAGSTFMRMQKGVRGHSALAFDQDCDRLIALMSVAANRPVAEAEVLPHVEAAAVHWRRGDKALANLRLAVAKLPQISDQTSAYRLALAEHLLDNGWSPRGLMIELGFAAPVTGFEKYNPNHVPAGHGSRSGQFDFGPGSIAVAEVDDDESFKAKERLGETTPKDEIEHGHEITPTTGMPILGSRGQAVLDTKTLDALSAAARVGPGPFAGRSVPAGPSKRPSPTQQEQINEIGSETGCHTCGTKDSGTSRKNWRSSTADSFKSSRYASGIFSSLPIMQPTAREACQRFEETLWKGTAMTDWLSSLGGPLICMEQKFAPSWRGIDGLSVPCDGAENDYDRAGLVWSTYTSLVALEAGGSALVLGGMPMDTIVRVVHGTVFMLRAFTSEESFDGDRSLHQLDQSVFLKPDEVQDFVVTSSPLVLFDSSFPGDEMHSACMIESTGDAQVFSLAKGAYRVLTCYVDMDLYAGVVHRFDRSM